MRSTGCSPRLHFLPDLGPPPCCRRPIASILEGVSERFHFLPPNCFACYGRLRISGHASPVQWRGGQESRYQITFSKVGEKLSRACGRLNKTQHLCLGHPT